MKGMFFVRNEDCIAGMRKMPDSVVDLVFADLPYGVTRNAWDELVPMDEFWGCLRRVCKPRAAVVMTAVQPFASLVVGSNPREFRYEMIWRKNKSMGFLDAKKRPLRAHENVLVFYRKMPTYAPQMTTGHAPGHAVRGRLSRTSLYGRTPVPRSWGGSTERYPTTVLDIPVVNSADPRRVHPNQKPVALSSWFIKTYTKPGDLVLDPTFGSASTLLGARMLGRACIGFETDKDLCERAAGLLCDKRAMMEAVV
jgi:DNA modification methylase